MNSNKKNPIECKHCDAFRPIKSYYSIFRNEGELNSEDMEKLIMRRDYEVQTEKKLNDEAQV